MSVSLSRCRARCEWALKHTKSLHETTKRFLEDDPYELVENLDRQTGEYSIRIKAEPPPQEIALLVGDVLHNLRSSLDHLVWQLTVANGKVPPSFPLPRKSPWSDVQFPIFLTEHQFRSQRRDALWGVSDKSRAFVKGLQPFDTGEDPEASTLWVLHNLSNIDKHRVPHLAVSYLRYFKAVSGPLLEGGTLGGKIVGMMSVPGVFDEDTEIMTIVFDPVPQMKVDMHAELDIDIAFHERSGLVKGSPVVETLTAIGAWVWEILRRAEDLPGVRR